MHADPSIVLWPDYQEFYGWLCQEVEGLTDQELDFDSHDPTQEWRWWSIRRQVSHMAWDLLIVMYRRCQQFLWRALGKPLEIENLPLNSHWLWAF
jgi:hypothetical protein